MNEALKKLALITFAVLICLLVTWMWLRQRALSTPPQEPLSHSFLQIELPAVIAYAPVDPTPFAVRRSHLDQWKALPPEIILWIPVQATWESELFVRTHTPEGADVEISLAEALARLPDRRLVLDFLDNRPGLVERIVTIVEAAQASDRILLQSPIDRLLTDLREQRPLWLYGTSRTQVTLMQMLSSIGLEPMSPVRGDVLVMESPPGRTLTLHPRVITEAKRRGLRVFAGPVATRDQARALLDLGVDGVMTSEPLQLIDQVEGR